MPAARQRARSSAKALAVMAMIGVSNGWPGADAPGRLEAVHFRHLHVHQDGRIATCAPPWPRPRRRPRPDPPPARRFELKLRHLAIHRFVVGDKHALPAERRRISLRHRWPASARH
jgi:hypothetical protein